MAALEIKSTARIETADSRDLTLFQKDYPRVPAWILAPIERPRQVTPNVTAVPWERFLTNELRDL